MKAAIVVLLLTVAACAGPRFSWENAAKVQNGMNEAEVVALLGKPHTRSMTSSTSGDIVVLAWGFQSIVDGRARTATYTLVNDRVVSRSETR